MTSRLLVALFAVASSASYSLETTQSVVVTGDVDQSLAKHSEFYESERDYWQLSEEEWKRYLTIKEKSPWSVWENHATPLAILAHYSDSIDDKRRYARINAELDQWRQHVVGQWQAIYNDEREVVHAKYVARMKNRLPILENVSPTDTIIYFVDVDGGKCNARCRGVTSRLIKTNANIHIYAINTDKQEVVFEWASKASIPIERVNVNQITLNFDNGKLQEIRQNDLTRPDLPMAYLVRNGLLEELVL